MYIESSWVRQLTALLCVLFSGVLFARELPTSPAERLENLQRQQELQENIQRELREQQRRAEQPVPALAEPLASPETGHTFLIEKINIDFGKNKPAVNVDDILKSFQGKQLGSLGLFNLIREVTNRYVEKGYSTTAVSLLPGSMKSGEISLQVHWGLVQGWLINGQPPSSWRERWLAETLLPGAIGEPLNIHDIDQAVESLSNGVKIARIDVIPSVERGYSLLNIILQPQDAVTLRAGVNNASPESTENGRYQFTISASSGDVLLPNDSLTVGGGSRYFSEKYSNDEYSGNISYTVPFGYSELGLRYSKTTYNREIIGAFGSYGSNGDSDTYALRFGHTLLRNKTDKLSAFTELEFKNSTNYIEDSLLEVNSQPYRTLALGLQYVTRVAEGSLYSDLKYTRGISSFGGQQASVDEDGNPRNFKKLQSNVSWSKSFSALEIPLDFSLRLSGQYSQDSMISSYKMGIGDEYTVRGYQGTPAWGDTGILLSNTLGHTLTLPEMPLLGTGNLNIYAGLDWGRVRDVSYSDGQTITLSGAALGIRSSWKYLSVGLGVGIPLSSVQVKDVPSEAVYLNIDTTY